MPSSSDYCDTCHELERDLLIVKTEVEYKKVINGLKEHLKRAKIVREEYIYLIEETKLFSESE